MTFPKQKSRLIIIDGTRFRWLVGPNDGYNIFAAEKEGIKGQIIEVYFDLRIITPGKAEPIIRQALLAGWQPDKKAKPMVFDLVNEELVARK